MKWIKIVTDIFDDEKILLIESMPERDGIIVIWFKLLCLAGKQNNGGVFMLNDRIPYTDEMLATIFRRPLNTVRLALQTFEQFGMVEIINGTVTIPNWGKHQSIESMQSRKEYLREYMREYRKKQKEIACNSSANDEYVNSKCLRKQHVNALDIEGDIEGDIEKDYYADKPQKKQPKTFRPPTIEEVKAYCTERQNNVDAERFVDYYTSNGWRVGKNPMKDWKAAVRTWEKHGWCGYGYGGEKKQKSKDGFENDSFDADDFDKLVNNWG